jgi:hypothetical protein
MEEKTLTKEEYKEHVQKEENEARQKIKIRMLPIWLRLIIIAGLITLSVILGALVGYSVIGNGEAIDVFQKATWTHIYEIINQDA